MMVGGHKKVIDVYMWGRQSAPIGSCEAVLRLSDSRVTTTFFIIVPSLKAWRSLSNSYSPSVGVAKDSSDAVNIFYLPLIPPSILPLVLAIQKHGEQSSD